MPNQKIQKDKISYSILYFNSFADKAEMPRCIYLKGYRTPQSKTILGALAFAGMLTFITQKGYERARCYQDKKDSKLEASLDANSG